VRPRAVITGLGVVSPFGLDRDAFFDGLLTGRTAVGPIRSFDARTFPISVAGEVPLVAIDAAALMDELARRGAVRAAAVVEPLARSGALRDRKIAFGLLAAAEAWRHAGLGDSDRAAPLVLGLGLEQAFLDDFAPIFADGDIQWAAERVAPLPAARFRTPVDACARACRELLGLSGTVVVNTSACAAGALAIAQAAELVAGGTADVVVCGGSDSMVNPLGIGGMSRLGAPSPRSAPDACRPFDRNRDGLVVGEGAAVFIVESEARARARGARPLAAVCGSGGSQDAYRVTAPRPDGAAAAAAIARALARAGLGPSDIGYVNAHGTGTSLNDPAECRALHRAFGADAARIPVSSIKGAIGHLMAAAGAVELAACVMALTRDVLPGTANHRERDLECDVDVLGPTPVRRPVEHTLSSSFGFGGQNAAVILGRVS
jgi:3-oxoacyl-[acyl-carrier-protein] synthase II